MSLSGFVRFTPSTVTSKNSSLEMCGYIFIVAKSFSVLMDGEERKVITSDGHGSSRFS